jgi:hypothetical protein
VGLELSPLAAAPESAPEPGGLSRRSRASRWPGPGAVLAWASVGPALVVAGWLAAVYPLAYAGRATPALALLAAAPAVALVLVAARRLPPVPGATWGPVLGTLAVAVAFTGYTLAHSAGHLVLRRDPAVYGLLARWIADSGALLVPARLDLIGTTDAVVTATAPGLYRAGGDDLSAQFMSGTALTFAPAGWVGGWGAILSMPALVGGCGVLAVAGLAARLLGPRWAPAAAAALALTQPMLLTARSTYSEPLAQLLLFAGACLLLDAVRRRSRPLAALAGLLIGLDLLVRIDAVREIALLLLVVGWLALRRHPGWWPLALGTLAGVAYGVVDGFGPAEPYLRDLSSRIRPAAAAIAAAAVLAAVVVPLGRRLTPWLLARAWWPRARTAAAGLATAGVAGVLAWLLLRPLVFEGRGTAAAWKFIEVLQREQGLPIDGQRSYAEQSVRWTSWYVGWPVLALAAVAAVLLTWRAVRGDRAAGWWALGLGLPLGSALSVLDNPSITPDHPWADRRLVPTVLPAALLLALWTVAALARAARAAGTADDGGPGNEGASGRRRRPRLSPAASRAAAVAVVVVGLLLVLVPAETGSRPLRDTRTEAGEPAAVDRACAAFAPGDVALLVDARARQEWTAVLREACGVPAFGLPGQATDRSATRGEVTDVAARIRAAGHRPVLVAQSAEPLPRLTGRPARQVVDLDTAEHQRLLRSVPRELDPLSIELWLAEPDSP